jgi:hypothetical protein
MNYKRHELLKIEAVEYENGLILYDLIYNEDGEWLVSDGLYDEVEVLAKLLYHLQVIDKEPRLLIRQPRAK